LQALDIGVIDLVDGADDLRECGKIGAVTHPSQQKIQRAVPTLAQITFGHLAAFQPLSERFTHRARIHVALLRIFEERHHHQMIQTLVNARTYRRGQPEIFIGNAKQGGIPRTAFDREPSGQELIQHHPSSKHIRLRIHRHIFEQFRRHIANGARHVRRGAAPSSHAKIHNARALLPIHHHILRLDIAVNHAFLVRIRQAIEYTQHQFHRRDRAHRAFASQPRSQRFALDKFKDQGGALIFNQDIMQSYDIRVRKLAD